MPLTDSEKQQIILKDMRGELTPAQSAALSEARKMGEFPPRPGAGGSGDPVFDFGRGVRTTVAPPSTRRAVGEFAAGTAAAMAVPGVGALPFLGRMAAVGGAEAGASVLGESFDPSGNPAARAVTTGAMAAGAQGAGEVAGSVLRGGIKMLFRGGKAGRHEVVASIKDFEKLGVTPTLAQATRSAMLDNLEQTISRIPGGAGRVNKVVREMTHKVAESTRSLAEGLSSSSADAGRVGRQIQSSIENDFLVRFKDTSDSLFTKLHKFVPKDSPVLAANTQGTLRVLTKGLESRPNLSKQLINPKIQQIATAFEKDVADGLLEFGELQELRSMVGRMLADNSLVSEAPKAQLKQLYAAISNDIRVVASGTEGGLKAFTRANNYYKAGMDRVETFLDPLVKKGTPEEVFNSLTRAGRQGATTLRAVRRSVDPSAWNAVVGLTLRRLGAARAGQQDAAGEVFSFETFLTNWNRLDPQARTALFEGSRFRGMKTQLDKISDRLTALARSAERIRESSKVGANPSGTAGAIAGVGGFTLMGFGAIQGIMGGEDYLSKTAGSLALAVPLFLMSTNGAARLITSPRFVRWLGKETSPSNKSILASLGRARGIVEAENMETQEAFAEYLNVFDSMGNNK